MSLYCISWAWHQDVESPINKLVLVKLCDISDKEGVCFRYSVQKLADHCGCGMRTFRRAVQHLSSGENPFIRVEEVPGKTNRFFIELDLHEGPPHADLEHLQEPVDNPVDKSILDPGQSGRGKEAPRPERPDTPAGAAGHPGRSGRLSVLSSVNYPASSSSILNTDTEERSNVVDNSPPTDAEKRYAKKVVTHLITVHQVNPDDVARTPDESLIFVDWCRRGITKKQIDTTLTSVKKRGIEPAYPVLYLDKLFKQQSFTATRGESSVTELHPVKAASDLRAEKEVRQSREALIESNAERERLRNDPGVKAAAVKAMQDISQGVIPEGTGSRTDDYVEGESDA